MRRSRAAIASAACICAMTIAIVIALAALPSEDPVAKPEVSALARARVLFTATPISGGRVLVVGGLADEHHPELPLGDAEVVELGDSAGALAPRSSRSVPLGGFLLRGRFFHAAVALDDGRVAVFGGDLAGSVELFDPRADVAGAFSPGGILPGKSRICLTATKLADGRVFVAGGIGIDKKPSRATELFDPKTAAVVAGPALTVPRGAHAAVLLADGRVFLAGGVKQDTTELYDPKANAVTAGPRLSTPRDDLAATLLADGTVLITGGQDARGKTLSICERFDPRSDALTRVGDLSDERADHVQLLMKDGSVLVMGGEQDDGKDHDVVLASVERFDPATGKFARAKPLSIPRDDFAAVLLDDGAVLVIAGQSTGDRVVASMEVWRDG